MEKKIAIIGTRGAGVSFVADYLAHLLSRAGQNINLVDASESKSIYKKYSLVKQQEAQESIELTDSLTIGIKKTVDQELEHIELVDYGTGEISLKEYEAFTTVLFVTDLDFSKFQNLMEMHSGRLKRIETVRLIVNKDIRGKVTQSSVIAGFEELFSSTHYIDFDERSLDYDLYSRITGTMCFRKLGRSTQKQLYQIANELIGITVPLRKLR